jgi:hypothetical protein
MEASEASQRLVESAAEGIFAPGEEKEGENSPAKQTSILPSSILKGFSTEGEIDIVIFRCRTTDMW